MRGRGGIHGGRERKSGGTNYEREFHKIHINRERERIVQPLKGCVSSRGATF